MRIGMLLLLGMWAGLAVGQNPACPEPEYRLFDYWVGSWDVYAGELKVGENTITPILDGCVLQEMWTSTGGGDKGTSLNYYNPKEKNWCQFWVWRKGVPLPMLRGNFADGKMILTGQQVDGAKTLHHRITWFKNADGTVRQLWENSTDGSAWTVTFDGLYKKRK